MRIYNDQIIDDPRTYEEAMFDIDSIKWQVTMNPKNDSMFSNQIGPWLILLRV